MKEAISVVIPTFNEEHYLPKLLRSLQNQSVKPNEIIIADAFSTDNTRNIALSFGCRVVDGGLPARGRNRGALVAKSEILLFLDADVVLPKHFIKACLAEFIQKKLDVACCFIRTPSPLKRDYYLHEAVNYYLRIMKRIHPRAVGQCIFIKRSLHQKIHGFNESLFLAEDHDYVERAAENGKFSFLNSYKLPVSGRRLLKEGRIKLALKYLLIEMHLLVLGKVTYPFINYEFGNHHQTKRSS
jgi:glycosyltransferase involved in cell wall biosynthesis